MSTTPDLSLDEYISFLRGANPSVKASHVALEWERLKEYLESEDQEEYPMTEELVNVPKWITAIKAAPTLTPQIIAVVSSHNEYIDQRCSILANTDLFLLSNLFPATVIYKSRPSKFQQ